MNFPKPDRAGLINEQASLLKFSDDAGTEEGGVNLTTSRANVLWYSRTLNSIGTDKFINLL